jgi:sarcosine/dimethylglycine N-methyltransferase
MRMHLSAIPRKAPELGPPLGKSDDREESEMKTAEIEGQYANGLTRRNIERALVAAGKDPDHVLPADLGALEDFHTLGRIATGQLAELAEISGRDAVLDAGTGIGGTARFLAEQYGCGVVAVDLLEEFCDTARWLNRLVGLEDRISVRQGDVTELPFPRSGFDVVISQHVQMNVSNKDRLYQEAGRVLVPGGRLAIWDVVAGTAGKIDFPLPWADQPQLSHLISGDQLRAVIEAAGFSVIHWNDLTEQAAPFMETLLEVPAGPLGLHAFIDNFTEKAKNLARGLSSGRLRVVQGVAQAPA